MTYPTLFSPQKIGELTIKNRLVMPAMGTGLANEDGTVSDAMLAFYEARAKGGAGLIITEVTMVDGQNGRNGPRQIGACDDAQIPGLKKLADKIHSYGTKLFLQLYHPGNQTFCDSVGEETLRTPSGVESRVLHQPAREMTKEEIHKLIEQFADAAARAQAAGIDGVEIHAAHGYLLNEFLSPYTNKRTDEYGGNWKGRAQIVRDIVVAIRKRVGLRFPVTLRMSVDEFLEMTDIPDKGLTLNESLCIIPYLVPFGVDAVSVSSGIYDTQNVSWEPTSYAQGWRIYLAEAVKKVSLVPVIAVSVIREPLFAEQILEEGKTDFVGIARGQLSDPEWGVKAQSGRENEIRKCISCLHCMESLSTGEHAECAINAESHHELEYGALKKDGNGRKVVIVGAGPSGMEAARVLALRGFKPILFEKTKRLGGQLYLAAKPPMKMKINWLIDYYHRQLELLGVDIRLNTVATVEEISREKPDAVFLATGSVPVIPTNLEGADGENVYSTVDILTGAVRMTGKKVVVVGSGMTGLETAEMLCEEGNKVAVIDMLEEIGSGLYIQNLLDNLERLKKYRTALLPGRRLLAIASDRIRVLDLAENQEETIAADAVVLSMGVRADRTIFEGVLGRYPNAVLLGDAGNIGRIAHAVRSGYLEAAALQ